MILILIVIFLLFFMLIYEIKKLKRIASTEGFLKYCGLGIIYCIMWYLPLYLSIFVAFSFGKEIGELAYIIPVIILCLSIFCWFSLCNFYPKLALPTQFLFTLFIIGNIIYKIDEEVSDLEKIKESRNKHSNNRNYHYIDTLLGMRSYTHSENRTDDILLIELMNMLDDLRNRNKH